MAVTCAPSAPYWHTGGIHFEAQSESTNSGSHIQMAPLVRIGNASVCVRPLLASGQGGSTHSNTDPDALVFINIPILRLEHRQALMPSHRLRCTALPFVHYLAGCVAVFVCAFYYIQLSLSLLA